LNSQDGNDDSNELMSGDADAQAETLNEVNNNWTIIGGSHSAHASADVADDGDAYALADDSDDIYVGNYNDADVENYTIAVALSGGNSQSWNDDDNTLESGEAHASSSVNNFVNNNVTVVGGDDEDGGSSTASATVGEDGDASSVSYDNDSVSVDNDNDADVTNVNVSAGVSGGNTQSSNDDGNSMTTGNATGTTCSTNTVNSNWTVIGGNLPEGSESGCN
jgi:hypothetical protein